MACIRPVTTNPWIQCNINGWHQECHLQVTAGSWTVRQCLQLAQIESKCPFRLFSKRDYLTSTQSYIIANQVINVQSMAV